METKILDDTPHWIVYLVSSVITVGTAFYWLTFVLKLRAAFKRVLPPRESVNILFKSLPMIGFASVACWFFLWTMFARFHAVTIAADHVELVFFWPRSRAVITNEVLSSASVVRYRRRGGYMQIGTKQKVFRSVDFRQFTMALEIQNAVTNHIVSHD